jgi:DNA-binding NtrC family response regulator
MGGADAHEGLEKVRDRLTDLRVGIQHDRAGLIVGETGGQDTSILTPPDLVEDPAAQARLQDVKLGFAHLERTGGNVSEVARQVGKGRKVIYRLMEEYGIKGEGTDPQ